MNISLQRTGHHSHFIKLFLIFLFLSFAVSLSAKEEKVINLGYFEQTGFTEGTSPEKIKKGFGYEFLQGISVYTGWKYNYVYGTNEELWQKLCKGEIDILAGIPYGENYPSQIVLSKYPMGKVDYFIYLHNDEEFLFSDYEMNLIGKTIGVREGARGETLIRKYVEEHKIDCTISVYPSSEALKSAFSDYKLDAIVLSNNIAEDLVDAVPSISVGELDFFIAANNSNPSLIQELNNAIVSIDEDYPYFRDELQAKYFNNKDITGRKKTPEKIWLKTHKSLKIGYLDDYLPFCDMNKNGGASGLVVDVMSALIAKLEIDLKSVEYVCYKDYKKLLQDLEDGQINMAFPFYGDIWYAEDSNILTSIELTNLSMEIIFKEIKQQDSYVLGVSSDFPFQEVFCKLHYPLAQLVNYKDINSSLEAVKSGEVDGVFHTKYIASNYLHKARNKELRSFEVSEKIPIAFAFRRNDSGLALLINHGIRLLGQDEIKNLLVSNVYTAYEYTFWDFISAHQMITIVILAILFSVIYMVCLYLRFTKNVIKEEKEKGRQLKYISSRDELTGVYNRHAYEEELHLLQNEEEKIEFCIITMDVNGLKLINDTKGHVAGDELIKGAAFCIEQIFGKYGHCFRTGGDEFSVILTKDYDENELFACFDSLVSKWRGHYVSALSVSYGYARGDNKNYSIEEICKNADTEMYKAKNKYYKNKGIDRRGQQSAYSVVCATYKKLLKVNLTLDSYTVVQLQEGEDSVKYPTFSASVKGLIDNGWISSEDNKKFIEMMSVDALNQYFDAGNTHFFLRYKRKSGDTYVKSILEMIPCQDYSEDNRVFFLYVKEIEHLQENNSQSESPEVPEVPEGSEV